MKKINKMTLLVASFLAIFVSKYLLRKHAHTKELPSIGNESSQINVIHPSSAMVASHYLSELAKSIRQVIHRSKGTRNKGELMRDSIAYRGSSERLHKALSSRRHLRFAVAGGSISAGHGVGAEQNYFSLIESMLSEPFRLIGMNATFHNVAIGATDSKYFAMCISEHLNLIDYDVLFLESITNDGMAVGWVEELVRTIWRANPSLQIIFVNFITPRGYLDLDSKRTFRCTARQVLESWKDVAAHYEIPMIQWHHVYGADSNISINALTLSKRRSLAAMYTSDDGLHPNVKAHKLMALFITSYLSNVIEDFISKPLIADTQFFQNTLKPIYQRSVIDATDCFITVSRPFMKNDKLKQTIVRSSNNSRIESFAAWMPRFVRNGLRLESELTYLTLPNKGDFLELVIGKGFSSHESCKRAHFRLYFAYRLCDSCAKGRVLFDVEISFEDGSRFDESYVGILPAFGVHANKLGEMFPVNNTQSDPTQVPCNPEPENYRNASKHRFVNKYQCFASVKSLKIRVTHDSVSYPFLLHGLIIAYDCCD